jgi:Xaa-Pro dipeptidase
MNTVSLPIDKTRHVGERLKILRHTMKELHIQAMLLTSPQAIFYYTEFESTGYYLPHASLITAEQCVLVIRDFESGPAISGEATIDRLFPWTSIKPFGESLREAFRACLPDQSVCCGFEDLSNFCPPKLLDEVRTVAHVRLVPLGTEVDRLRQRKSRAEVALAERAGSLAAAAIGAGLHRLSRGCSEIEISTLMMSELVRLGGGVPASYPYAYFGPRSWNRMQQPSRKRLEVGETAYLECGAAVNRYGAALLRTAVCGPPTEPLLKAYGAARRAFEHMVAALRPGAVSGEVDRKASAVLAAEGYEKVRLLKGGYSIGVGFAPGWGEANVFDISVGNVAIVEEDTVLHLVMVLMIEEIGAVGLSETMHVTLEGARSLTPFSRDLMIIPP